MTNNTANYQKMNIHQKLKFKENQTNLLEKSNKEQAKIVKQMQAEIERLKAEFDKENSRNIEKITKEESIRKALKKIYKVIGEKEKQDSKIITIRIKNTTLEYIKSQEKMYQRLINRILNCWVEVSKEEGQK